MTDRRKMRLTDIAISAELDKATAFRLLKLLVIEGFIVRDPETKRYGFGKELFLLSAALQSRTDLRSLARPSIVRLAHAFGDTTILSVPSAMESVCLDICFGNFPIRANYLDIGTRRPLGAGAGSFALLYCLPDAEIAAIFPKIITGLEKYRNITPHYVKEQIGNARIHGHAVLIDVIVEGMGGIGVPILDSHGRSIGAISIAALTNRILSREEHLARALKRESGVIAKLYSENINSYHLNT